MNNKTVLITGVSLGIGKELALYFSKNDWNVCGCYRVHKPEYEIPHSKFFRADISKHDEAKLFIESAYNEFGEISCVINNASISKNKIIFREQDENWNEVIQTNLNGTFYVLKEALRIMAKQHCGSIINLASISAYRSFAGAASYSASKAGVIALTKTAAREGGRFGVTVNAVLPGFHLTKMGKSAGYDYMEYAKRDSVLNTTTDINELLDFIYMLSHMKTVSGQVFNVDSRII
ncbi:MAG: SDR family oxidoreductase [Endomicrobium sp.]|jgi:3-oxoacyl-[acyl-carrier protein] reductase|nr:SDR family oxidoreductase [Endomicrobium sp.]